MVKSPKIGFLISLKLIRDDSPDVGCCAGESLLSLYNISTFLSSLTLLENKFAQVSVVPYYLFGGMGTSSPSSPSPF